MGSKAMVSCLGWLFVCISICLIPQLCSALVGASPKSLLSPLSSQLPFPSLPGTAVTGEGFLWVTLFRGRIFLCALVL